MPNLLDIRRRIKSVKNISQITRAMEMMAAARMRRAQQATLATRPYVEVARDVLSSLARQSQGSTALHPLLEQREVRNVGLILITSDRGLAGGFNANMIREALRWMRQQTGTVSVITVGRKGRDFMVRYGRPLVAEFIGIGNRPTIKDTYPIARVAIDEFTSGKVDAVYLVYTDFVNTLIQRPTLYRLLPVDLSGVGDEGSVPGENVQRTHGPVIDYIYEHDAQQVLSQLVPRYV